VSMETLLWMGLPAWSGSGRASLQAAGESGDAARRLEAAHRALRELNRSGC
jgi:hypothetical protein